MRRTEILLAAATNPDLWSRHVLHRPLRAYQLPVARAILDAVLRREGGEFAVMMSRQSGKNETAAQVESLLLNMHRLSGGTIIKTAPTLTPQLATSLERLAAIMAEHPLLSARRRSGNVLWLGKASLRALSGHEAANVVGATASILLECDEAQDVDAEVWDKRFRPMAASTNAVSVLWGTPWTSRTLLAQTIERMRELERKDGRQRVFTATWREVGRVVPAYRRYVEAEIARLGANHPLVRTQYELQTIDEQAGLFPAATRVLMRGNHPRQRGPHAGRVYAFLIDVAGAIEVPGSSLQVPGTSEVPGTLCANPRQDATVLTIVELSASSMSGTLGGALGGAGLWPAEWGGADRRPAPQDENEGSMGARASSPALLGGMALNALSYHVMDRYIWHNVATPELFGAITALCETWEPRHLVIDATGLGAGLATLLGRALGSRVIPFLFTAQSKSDLGWRFLSICNAGRFRDHGDDGSPEQAQFWREVAACEYETLPGPGQRIRWGVRDPQIHDDALICAALCAVIDGDYGALPQPSQIIAAPDPLDATQVPGTF